MSDRQRQLLVTPPEIKQNGDFFFPRFLSLIGFITMFHHTGLFSHVILPGLGSARSDFIPAM